MATVRQILKLIICCAILLSGLCDETCDDMMRNNNIIPDYADKIDSTNMTLCSEFIQILCGKAYAPSLLGKRPTVYFDGTCDGGYYAILFFGECDESNSTSLLWFEYNIPAYELKTGYTGQEGNEMVIYQGPKTSMNRPGKHMLFIYCQSDGQMGHFYCCGPDERDNFFMKSFAQERNFGSPVAGIFFTVTASGQLMNSTSYSNSTTSGSCPAKQK